jgi:hypothetical protein
VPTEIGRMSYFFLWSLGMAKPSRWCQLVGVEGRHVAYSAALTREDCLPTRGYSIESVGVLRWLKRIDVERQRIQLFVAVTAVGDFIGFGQALERDTIRRHKATLVSQAVRALVESGVSHHVHNRTMLLEAGVVEVVAGP